MRRRVKILALACALLPGTVLADDVSTEVLAVGDKVVFDGLLDEWRGLTSTEVPIVDKTSHKGSSDLSVGLQSLHDKSALYFAITVKDDKFLRTGSGTVGEDKVVLWFGGDASGTKKPIVLSFLPGDLASISQDLRVDGKKVPAPAGTKREIQALEAFVPKESLWTVEMEIPWEKLPSDLRGREQVPFCLAVFDGDDKSRPRVEAIAATCSLSKGEPSSLGWLVRNEDATIFEGFLKDVKLGRSDLNQEFYADAGGDTEIDRVVVAGAYVAILGFGLGDNYYYYYHLGIKSSSDIKDVQMLDVDGDGKQNLIIRSVEYDTSMAYSQEILRVFGLTGGYFKPFFGQEVAGSQKEGSISSKFEWKKAKKGKGYELTVSQAEGKGITDSNYVDIDAKDTRDYEEILLPWGSDKKVTYRFASGKAEVVK